MDATGMSRAPDSAPFENSGARVMISERPARCLPGIFGVAVLVICVIVGVMLLRAGEGRFLIFPVLAFLLVLASLAVVQPGQARVVQFFGRYAGTVRRPGLTWLVPLSTRHRLSVRVRNFETRHLRVNDADGNPIEIAAVVVWQVADTAKAVFAVDDYVDFVSVQAESALRHIAAAYPYDDGDSARPSLRAATELIATELSHEMTARVAPAGVEVVEVRISHLAYAPEIAQAMLRRQ